MSQNLPQTYQIAHFALHATYDALGNEVTDQLKRHLLDSLGSLIHSLQQPVIHKLVRQIKAFSETGNCTVPVIGATAPDRAAQFYTALISYPGFSDSYLGKGAACSPSDNTGALLAASQLTGATGKEFLTALAVAYETECRLATELPMAEKVFDHTLLLAYSLTAALCKLFSLTEDQAAHAIGIAGSTFNPLAVSRASYTYEWRGLVSSMVAQGCMTAVFLAREGIKGPLYIFEGHKGLKEIFDKELKYHWQKDHFELIRKCILRKYSSEVHTQSLVEAALELRESIRSSMEDIDEIDVKTYLTAYNIAGGGEFGNRKEVHSREQADQSLPYVIAIALLDGQVYPEQFLPDRINRPDIQQLLRKVTVHTSSLLHRPATIAGLLDPFTVSYPGNVLGKVTIRFKNGKEISAEKEDYHGFFTRPFSWTDVVEKFKRLTGNSTDAIQQQRIIDMVANLENEEMHGLIHALNSEWRVANSEQEGIRNRP